jgi:hypothetical protein
MAVSAADWLQALVFITEPDDVKLKNATKADARVIISIFLDTLIISSVISSFVFITYTFIVLLSDYARAQFPAGRKDISGVPEISLVWKLLKQHTSMYEINFLHGRIHQLRMNNTGII